MSIRSNSSHRVPALSAAGLVALGLGTAAAVRGGNTPPPALEQPLLSGLMQEFRNVSKSVHPWVVTIEARGRAQRGLRTLQPRGLAPSDEEMLRRFFGGQMPNSQLDSGVQRFDPSPKTGSGSGWVWSADGLIVTNNHVVANADELVVRLSDGRELAAEVVGADPATDVALLRVEADGLTPALVSNEKVQQGDIVFTFGAPFSISDSMSQGIVAGVGRQTGILGAGGYEQFIQTDAVINPGNSGGPLVDVHGRVVGMNTAILSSNGFFGGIGFAIPVDVIRPVVEQLRDSGAVQRGYLGVTIQDDPELVASFGAERGVVIGSVMPSGPGEEAGLQRGDVIQAIAGIEVDDVAALRFAVAEHAPGAKVEVALVRSGELRRVEVTLGRSPLSGADSDAPTTSAPRREMKEDASVRLRELGIEGLSVSASLDEGGAGVRIDSVRAGSVLAEKGVRPGEVISAVDGTEVRDIVGLSRAISAHDLTQGVRLSVRGAGGLERFVWVRLAE